jgi:hypothetical protein
MFEKKIGIDLGTYSILIYMKGRGIVLQEPSIVAISQNEDRIVAIGEEARAMLGRVPEAIEISRPLRNGVIADYYVTERMLDFYINRLVGWFRLFPPEIMISTPVGILFSLDSGKTWDSLPASSETVPPVLGEKQVVYSNTDPVWTNNESDRAQYDGTLLNILTELSLKPAETEGKVTVKSKPSNTPATKERKRPIKKFFDKIFGKKKKDG